MNKQDAPVAIAADQAPPRATHSILPEPFASRMQGRTRHPLGELFGLTNFGVNLTRLLPGGVSALRHTHSRQDEFIYILQGRPVLVSNAGETQLAPGMCAGFKAGNGDAHQLLNRTGEEVLYLEVGDRSPGDTVLYPDEDLRGILVDGQWRFTHRDGTPY